MKRAFQNMIPKTITNNELFMMPVHKAQAISYLKLADKRLAFLVNFNVPLINIGGKQE